VHRRQDAERRHGEFRKDRGSSALCRGRAAGDRRGGNVMAGTEQNRRWRQAHPESREMDREYSARYRAVHQEHIREMRGIGVARAKYRYKTDPAFRERAKERSRDAYHSNPEMHRGKSRDYYRQHKKRLLARTARYRREHAGETRQYLRAWRSSEKGRTYKTKLRASAADCYIRSLLRRERQFKGVVIPDELVKAFRQYLLLLREIKKAKEAINGTGN
jgi:hypothetical protein